MSHDTGEATGLAGTRAPMFTARVDRSRGAVLARGRLDRVGAEQLCSSVAALCALGHRTVTVQLEPDGGAEQGARTLLEELAGRLAREGVTLVVV